MFSLWVAGHSEEAGAQSSRRNDLLFKKKIHSPNWSFSPFVKLAHCEWWLFFWWWVVTANGVEVRCAPMCPVVEVRSKVKEVVHKRKSRWRISSLSCWQERPPSIILSSNGLSPPPSWTIPRTRCSSPLPSCQWPSHYPATFCLQIKALNTGL